MADGAVTRSKIDDAIGPELAKLVIPAGLGPIPWSGRTAPTGWVLMGATYNRADYPALWLHAQAEITSGANDIYGVGDGSTTFTIADPNNVPPTPTARVQLGEAIEPIEDIQWQ